MTDQSSVFPAFIRAEYEDSGNGFPAFERAAAESSGRVRRQFESSFTEIGKVINNALGKGIGSAGTIDLGLSEFRQAAAEAKLYEQAITATLRTTTAFARETGDTTAATQAYIQALQAQRVEAERASQTSSAQVATYTRLQAALDATSASNSKLAQSYRDAEQARYASEAATARQDVSGRRAQEFLAPGLTRRATDSGAGSSALDAFAREAEQAEQASMRAAAAAEVQAQALENLRRAETGAANGAALLNALHKGTALEAGRVAKSYNDVAAAFAAADREAEQLAIHQSRLAATADQLRSELDPMHAAQKRFDQEMDRADDLLKAGTIAQREYAAAVLLARNNLQAANSAVHATTGAFLNQGKALGAQRQVYVQTGQQLQDIAISLKGGQEAGIVFAQQLPQLAFALSGLGIQADGTQKGIGRIATLLSGPWGVAFVGASAVVGSLVGKLWEQDEASKAAEDAAKKHADAITALGDAMDRSVQSAEDKARADFEQLEIDREATLEIRKKTQAILELAQADLNYRIQQTRGPGTTASDVASFGLGGSVARVKELEAQLKDNQAKLDRLTRQANEAKGQYQKIIIDDMATPEGRLKRKYEPQMNQAIARGDEEAYARLRAARDAEMKQIEATNKALGQSVTSRDAETATVSQVSKLLIGAFGGTITSGKRSKAANAAAGGAEGSYHLRGQAVDFVPAGGMGSISKAQIRAAVEAAGLTVKELLGPGDKGHSDHFHLAFSGGKSEMDSAKIRDAIDRQKAQDEAEAAREVARATTTVINAYDEVRTASIGYEKALEDIATAVKGGGISLLQAGDYILALNQKLKDEESKRITADLSGGKNNDPTDDLKRIIAENMAPQIRDASEIAARNLIAGGDAVADALGQAAASFLDEMARRAGKGSALEDLVKGVGSGRNEMRDRLAQDLNKVISKIGDPEKIGKAIGIAMEGARMGETYGKGLADALGIKGSKFGSQVGGAIGGTIAGPIGSIVGGFIGSTIGGALKKTPSGSATIGIGADGNLVVTGLSGSSNKLKEAANSNAGSAIQTIENIAATLGGTVNASKGSVSIGFRKGNARVDETGNGITKTSKGAIDFGEDTAAAVKYATLNLIKDGIIEGLRASTQKLLLDAKDLDAAIQKALDFESVFTRLKGYEDPVGAAIDGVDKEFTRLKKVFAEAAASTEEYAALEKLYGIERAAAVKEAGERVTASLKGLFDDLTTNNDALSLRTRKVSAQGKYDELATRVAAGDKTAYDDYADAARTLLDIERQISGSTTDYFTLLNQVTDLTKSRIDSETNVASIAEARDSIFGTTSAASVAPIVTATEMQTRIMNDNQQVQTQYLTAMNDNLIRIGRAIEAGGKTGGSSSIDTEPRLNF